MKICRYKFNNYILGLFSLIIVCILPLINPILYFANNKLDFMPYILILIAIFGILYEFAPIPNATKFLKIETIIVYISSIIFLAADITLFIIKADNTFSAYNFFDYMLTGYAIAPIVVTIIEIIRSIKEDINQDNNNGNKIAVGNTGCL